MLLWNLDLLTKEPVAFFALLGATVLALLIAITVHEASHALISYRLGDPTAKMLGRLSLNPVAHLDPMGTLMLFLVGFGWGKPVPTNPYLLRGERRSGMAWVALGGPLANFFVVALLGLLIRSGTVAWHSPFEVFPFLSWDPRSVAADIVGYIIFYNLILGVFNLIPIAPLDGFRVAVGILPRDQAIAYERTERYGPGILLIFVLIGYASGFLWSYLLHAVNLLARILVGSGLLR